ncbi:MAG: DUF368 domain-containing protein [Defluviitaleaceae bacterium]|nr:DUF368 domain-containing protein [Defluviitaleaceae bacterium]
MKKLSLNFIKGIFIGVGALLPGLSGGALATIFGIYEPLINFISNIKKDFKVNIKRFIPVVFGGVFGVFLLSFALSYFLQYHLAEISIFFVGCMLGVLPTLIKQSGLKGRSPIHLLLTVTVSIGSFLLLSNTVESTFSTHSSAVGIWTWVVSGIMIGLGITFPGLSPSNFLMYLNLYQPLNEAISQLNFTILMPVILGGILSVISTAKLVTYLLRVAYPIFYHVILGLVLTSTVMIMPQEVNSVWMSSLCFIAGLTVGNLMRRLEDQDEQGQQMI